MSCCRETASSGTMAAGTESSKYDHLFKLLLVGDAGGCQRSNGQQRWGGVSRKLNSPAPSLPRCLTGVGKSSILLRFKDGVFEDMQQSTIGVDFKVCVASNAPQAARCTLGWPRRSP